MSALLVVCLIVEINRIFNSEISFREISPTVLFLNWYLDSERTRKRNILTEKLRKLKWNACVTSPTTANNTATYNVTATIVTNATIPTTSTTITATTATNTTSTNTYTTITANTLMITVIVATTNITITTNFTTANSTIATYFWILFLFSLFS